jgi:pilus assembly protein CpaC
MNRLAMFGWTTLASLLVSASAPAQPPRRGSHTPPPPPPAADETPAAPAAPQAERRPQVRDLALAVGESRTIPATDVANYSEGTPGIIDVKLTSDAQQFVIVGLKPGSTSLLLIGRDGSQTNVMLNVFARSPEQVEGEVRQLIDGYTGVRVRRVGSRFFIEGGVSNEGDLKRIEQLAKLYPGQVESLVGVGAGAADRNTNIRIDVFFVQYQKDSSYNVGVSWPSVIGGPSLQSNISYDFITHTPTVQASAVNQPLPGLDIATTHGWAKVLKQATVITTNGVEAKLANGGEQNFSVANGLTSTIRPITFGTTVTVVPRFDPQSKDLEVKLDADVSDLTPSISGTSLPGRQTANLTTLVHLKLGQSLVLSGIHTFAKTHSVTGIPILSEIPVLGVLFGGHSDSETEVEGAVFIIPSVMDANEKSALTTIEEAMKQYEKFSGNMEDLQLYEKNPSLEARPAHLQINAVMPAPRGKAR